MPKDKKEEQLQFEMPRTHLGRLAEKFVKQTAAIATEKEELAGIKDMICTELAKENRKTLAIEDGGKIYHFEIKTTGQKLVVTKSKMAVGYQGHLNRRPK